MVELLSYQIFVSIGIVFLQIWYTCLVNLEHITSWWIDGVGHRGGGGAHPRAGSGSSGGGGGGGEIILQCIIRYLPLWAILFLGIYALVMVVLRVKTMKDCPEAALSLAREITDVKESLRRRGFVF
jgi:hypothetical protein